MRLAFFYNFAKSTINEICSNRIRKIDVSELQASLLESFDSLSAEDKLELITKIVSADTDDAILKTENKLQLIRLKIWVIKALFLSILIVILLITIVFIFFDVSNTDSKIASFLFQVKNMFHFIFS
jgi:hypothetical protein